MKIRSITYFCNPGFPLKETKIRAAGEFLADAQAAFEAEGYEVQTTRVATVPFPHLLGEKRLAELAQLAVAFQQQLGEAGISYGALGPALPEMPTSYAVIPEAIAACENVFFSGKMDHGKKGISMQAVHACADIIQRNASILPTGFANLRFAALANVPPGTPFFPAAYHTGEEPAFSLAMEAADAAVQAFGMAGTISEGQQNLTEIIEENAHSLVRMANVLKFKHQVRFGGIDFSLAPFPERGRSVGAAVEAMGVARVGLHGSLAGAAILTGAIELANFPRAGFCGLFQPVLEDAVLAQRAAEGTLTVKDLLLYSAVCGTGLDTIPLPGEVSAGQMAGLLLDICALALRLDKPLTARLMPIPGKQAGDAAHFDFDYFANSRVMRLEAEPLEKGMQGDETIKIEKRIPKQV